MKKLLSAACFFFILAPVATAADLQFAIVADAGKTNRNSEATRESIAKAGVFDLILPGDNLYESTYSAVWSSWIQEGFRFAVTAIGNHNAGYDAETRFFSMPGEYYAKQFQGRVRFIVLNSDNVTTATRQAAFLESELARAQEPFIFVVYHHPSYTLSRMHAWTEKRNFQLAVRPVLARHREKITALLLGHDHLATLAHFDDLPVVISGAVWETRRDSPVDNVQSGVHVRTDWYYDGQAHWAKITLDDQSNQATLQFVKSSNGTVQCTLRIATGQRAEMMDDCR